ncbi:MAG: hypothetical protein CFE26_24845 [Verrucomicrobiales bacterium VVV1]|nr:MAG: hypothetical protein CFE26_24845 [Verrucomicrobiales bacterium VVV1]
MSNNAPRIVHRSGGERSPLPALLAFLLAFFNPRSGITALLSVAPRIFAFIAAHAIGQALGSFTHWIFAALLATFFPSMVTAFAPGYVFLLFCTMMVPQLVWVKLMVRETKGATFEDIDHPFAGRAFAAARSAS